MVPLKGRWYKWEVLLIACIGSLMAPLDSSIIGVSLPEISQSLGMDYASVIWVPTAYLATIAALLLSFGRLSDMKGRKWLYVLGFGIFTVGSVACSLSTDGTQLIASRVFQGIGGAFMMAVSPAMITAAFPGEDRGKALGINALFVYIGLSMGPPLGGFLTDAYGWQSIFLVNIPIGIVVIALACIVIKNDSHSTHREFDIKGAVLFSIALVSLLLALTFAEELGWTSLPVLGGLVIAIVSGYVFLVLERGLGENAMLNIDLITKNKLFAAANTSALLNYTAFFGISFIISFYLQRVLSLSLVETGFILLMMPMTMAIFAPISGWLSDRYGSRVLATSEMVILSVGLLLMATLNESSDPSQVMVALVIIGSGMGVFSSPNTSAIMGCVRKDQLGQASGVLSTMRTVGQSLSLAIMGAIISIIASPDVVTAVFSGGEASSVAISEFVDGMHVAFIVGAFIALVGAGISSVRGKVSDDSCTSGP
jgi:EmrB/QacA subfamily drug resistance transporter